MEGNWEDKATIPSSLLLLPYTQNKSVFVISWLIHSKWSTSWSSSCRLWCFSKSGLMGWADRKQQSSISYLIAPQSNLAAGTGRNTNTKNGTQLYKLCHYLFSFTSFLPALFTRYTSRSATNQTGKEKVAWRAHSTLSVSQRDLQESWRGTLHQELYW